MKLKKYLQFIKESLKEDLESKKLYLLDEDQIREYLVSIEDAGYIVNVNFGFSEKITRHFYNKPSEEKVVYTEKIKAVENVNPSYWIEIIPNKDINNEDVTDALKFACSIISEQADAEIELHDEGGQLDPDSILIKGGIFYDGDLEIEGYLRILVIQKNSVKITQKDLEDYYGWNVEVEKNGQLYVEIDLEDLSDYLLESRDSYKEILVKGQEVMWDNYDISYYSPDITSLFQYDLDKENEVLVIKSIIKELGGFEQTINHIGDECDDEVYEKVKEMSEEELINYLLKERFYETIKQLSSDSEVLGEVKETVANWEMSAHCDTNYKEIVDEFDSIVEDELGQFEKIEKEVTKYYNSKDAEGNQVRREYKTDITYYQFPYSNDWISETDSEYLYNKELDDLFRDFVRESDIDRNLIPRISDYGDVNKSEMNKDINAYLKRYLSN